MIPRVQGILNALPSSIGGLSPQAYLIMPLAKSQGPLRMVFWRDRVHHFVFGPFSVPRFRSICRLFVLRGRCKKWVCQERSPRCKCLKNRLHLPGERTKKTGDPGESTSKQTTPSWNISGFSSGFREIVKIRFRSLLWRREESVAGCPYPSLHWSDGPSDAFRILVISLGGFITTGKMLSHFAQGA